VKRRTFLGVMTGGLLAVPLAVEAQPAGRIPRIAFLSTTSPENSLTTDAFRTQPVSGYAAGAASWVRMCAARG
jgi:hypothetical protein